MNDVVSAVLEALNVSLVVDFIEESLTSGAAMVGCSSCTNVLDKLGFIMRLIGGGCETM